MTMAMSWVQWQCTWLIIKKTNLGVLIHSFFDLILTLAYIHSQLDIDMNSVFFTLDTLCHILFSLLSAVFIDWTRTSKCNITDWMLFAKSNRLHLQIKFVKCNIFNVKSVDFQKRSVTELLCKCMCDYAYTCASCKVN